MASQLKQLLSSILALPTRARRLSGLCCITLGVIGCILPILPGLPFLVVGGRLLGRRDPLLRRSLTLSHRAMRRLRTSGQPALRRIVVRLHPHWRRLARLVLG